MGLWRAIKASLLYSPEHVIVVTEVIFVQCRIQEVIWTQRLQNALLTLETPHYKKIKIEDTRIQKVYSATFLLSVVLKLNVYEGAN